MSNVTCTKTGIKKKDAAQYELVPKLRSEYSLQSKTQVKVLRFFLCGKITVLPSEAKSVLKLKNCKKSQISSFSVAKKNTD